MREYTDVFVGISLTIAIAILNWYGRFLPPGLDIVILLLILSLMISIGTRTALHIFRMDFQNRIKWMFHILIGVIDGWRATRERIEGLKDQERIDGRMLKELSVIYERKMLDRLITFVEKSLSPSQRVEEIKELLKKVKDRTITEGEARRLKVLLEEEKCEREAKGDLEGAITIGLFIISVIGLITDLSLLSKKEVKSSF